ncbi:MAG: BACON domain-containing carbohydrate-binding protein, partial [Aliarcobacter skirrowii]
MYVVETSSSVFPSSGGTTIFRILDGEGGSPVTNFWYTLSTGERPSWETHTKKAETFTVTFDENTEQEERSITYTFYREVDVDGVLTEESASVTVTQTGYTIPSSVDDVEITEEQQTTEIIIENVSNASISINSPWVSFLTPSSNVLQLFIQENEESTKRTATVTLNFSTGSLSFNVIQAASSTSNTGTVIYDDEGEPTEYVQIVETLEHEITNTGAVVDVTPNANAVLPLSFYGSNVPWIYDVQQPDETARIVIRRNPDGETHRKGTFRVIDGAGKINIITVNQEAGATPSGENYRFFFKRYVMRQEAVSVPVTQTRTILQNLAVERETANFSLSSIARSDFLAPHGDDEGLDEWKIDGYDAYSLCCRHVTNETTGIVTHTLLAGAVLYRFDLPWADGTPAVNSLRLSIKSDAYTPSGAKITLVKINRGATQFVRSDMIALSTENKVARRRVSGENWVSTVEDVQIQSFSFVPTEATTLGVLVELEDYAHIRDSWVEGSSGLNLPVVFNFADVIPGMENFGNGEVAVNPTTGAAIPATSATFSPTMILTNGRVHLANYEATLREFCYLSSSVIALPVATNLEISPPGTKFFAPNTASSFNFDVTSLPTSETQFGVVVSDTNWMSVSTTATSFEVLLSAQRIGATARTGTVTITSGAQSKVLTFNQAAGEVESHLELSSTSASIAATDTNGSTFFVTSFPNGAGTNYTASSDVEWLSFTTSGNAISWTAKKNGYGSPRDGHIQIASGDETVNFTVTQAANSTPMLAIPTNGILEPSGGSTTFDLQYPEGTTINGVSLSTGASWAQATLLSGNAQVSTQSALNYGDARVGIVTVTATYDGVDYQIKYAIRQKGTVPVPFSNKLTKLSPTGVASNLVGPVTTSNIDHISVCGDTCFLSGSFTNLFGETGKNWYVPVGITANATKAITQDGKPSSLPYTPQVMLRGYLSCPFAVGDPRGNPLYGAREFANSNKRGTEFLYDVNATTIGRSIPREVWWADNGTCGVHGVSKMVSPPIYNMLPSHIYYWSLFNGSKIVKRCAPRAKWATADWDQYPALPSQPYALAVSLDGSKIYAAGAFGLKSNSTSS